jgi:Holliday junction resolvasome RuvABC endonuclease subunit
MRKKLVYAIVEYAGDELDYSDLKSIATESEEELVDRLIHILEYYSKESN